jgi:hypothetical protein
MGRKACDQDGQDGKSFDQSFRCSGRLQVSILNARTLPTVVTLTFWIWESNFGGSFAQALAATLPSAGSSAVIVLSAIPRAVKRFHGGIDARKANPAPRYL